MFSFQDELEGRLRSRSGLFDENKGDETNKEGVLFSDDTSPKDKKEKRRKKKKKKRSTEEAPPLSNGGDEMFSEGRDEFVEGMESPFGKSKGLFSGGGNLFDAEEGIVGVSRVDKMSDSEASVKSNRSGKSSMWANGGVVCV